MRDPEFAARRPAPRGHRGLGRDLRRRAASSRSAGSTRTSTASGSADAFGARCRTPATSACSRPTCRSTRRHGRRRTALRTSKPSTTRSARAAATSRRRRDRPGPRLSLLGRVRPECRAMMGEEHAAGAWTLRAPLPGTRAHHAAAQRRSGSRGDGAAPRGEVTEPGVYRIEAHRHWRERERPWIYSNPIYLRLSSRDQTPRSACVSRPSSSPRRRSRTFCDALRPGRALVEVTCVCSTRLPGVSRSQRAQLAAGRRCWSCPGRRLGASADRCGSTAARSASTRLASIDARRRTSRTAHRRERDPASLPPGARASLSGRARGRRCCVPGSRRAGPALSCSAATRPAPTWRSAWRSPFAMQAKHRPPGYC